LSDGRQYIEIKKYIEVFGSFVEPFNWDLVSVIVITFVWYLLYVILNVEIDSLEVCTRDQSGCAKTVVVNAVVIV